MFKCVAIVLFTLFATQVLADAKFEVGDALPSYLGKDPEGNKIELEDHLGKVVVVSFWASWCPPCLKELPALEAIQNAAGKDKLTVVAVNFKESKKQYRHIKKKLASLNLTLTHDKRGSLSRKYGVDAIPNTFIVGKDGKLAYHSVGYGDKTLDKLVTVLNKLLAEPDVG